MERQQKPKSKNRRNISNSSKIYSSDDIHVQIVQGLNEQRQKGLFCDIVLIADGVRFLAHRNILAASSSYFHSMFTLGMRETYQKEVELVGTSAIECKAVLDFLYGNKPSLNHASVYCVLKTAHLLQVWKLVDVCCEFLERELDEKNYLLLQELASTYSLEHLDSAIDCFVLKNFARLCFTPNFAEKIPLEKICLYLDSDRIQVKVERNLLKAALQWLNHSPERAKESQRVLQNIRFSLIPKRNLINLVRTSECSLLHQHINCHSFIYEAIHYHKRLAAQPVLQNRRSTLRADGDRLLFLGGTTNMGLLEGFIMKENNVICSLDPKRGNWKPETGLPTCVGHCCAAVLGNFIFCAGGMDIDEEEQRMVYRYDPRCNRWTQVASMNQGRQFFYFAGLENRLIAVGGTCMDDDVLSSVEVYNPKLNSWSFGAALPRPTYCHAGTTFKQQIYISGGTNVLLGRATRCLLCYNYHMDTWEKKKEMSMPRVHHSMCTLGDHIYAIGGRDTFQSDPMGRVEYYSPVFDQWTWVAPLLQPASHLGVAVWRGGIYVLGGENSEDEPLKLVQVYDHAKDEWTKGTPLPERLAGVFGGVCVLKSTKKKIA